MTIQCIDNQLSVLLETRVKNAQLYTPKMRFLFMSSAFLLSFLASHVQGECESNEFVLLTDFLSLSFFLIDTVSPLPLAHRTSHSEL